MKKYYLTLLSVLLWTIVNAQTENVKIVFDVTSSDVGVHQSTLRHVKGMSKNYPNAQFEVVIYSGAIDMILKDKSSIADDIESFANNDNIKFVVCEMSMKRHEIGQKDLLAGVTSVPDGILEIFAKQQEGWGYIKEAN